MAKLLAAHKRPSTERTLRHPVCKYFFS